MQVVLMYLDSKVYFDWRENNIIGLFTWNNSNGVLKTQQKQASSHQKICTPLSNQINVQLDQSRINLVNVLHQNVWNEIWNKVLVRKSHALFCYNGKCGCIVKTCILIKYI